MFFSKQDVEEIFPVLGQKTLSAGKRLTATQYRSDNILAYDLAMFSGSSGAPIIRVDAPADTFCGIHIGGENYQDSCWPIGWNHAYSVTNPHFVLLYVRYVVPHWQQSGMMPHEVQSYVRAHSDIIYAHKGWLGAQLADWLLSL